MRATRRRWAALLGLWLLVLTAAGMLTAGPAHAQDDAGGAGSTAPADPSTICDPVDVRDVGEDVGTTQRAGPIEVTVTDVTFSPTVQDFFDEGYLIVDFQLTNLGDDPVDYSGYSDWALLDAQPGGVSPSPLDPTAAMADATLGTGDGVDGHVAFPVGFGGGDYRVRFEHDGFWGSDDQAFWRVRVEPHTDPSPGPAVDGPTVSTDGFENLQSYDIQIDIDEQGDAHFTETIEYDFANLQRHGIYRDLVLRQRCNDRYDRVYPLHDVSVTSPTGAPAQFTIEDLADGKRIKIGDADQTITGEHTYVIRYTLEGTLNGFPDHDELYWNVVGDRWTVQLADIHVVVNTPGDVTRVACFAGELGSRAACERAVVGPDGDGRFRQPVLYAGDGMSVVVAFPTGLVPTPEPILDERWSLARAFSVTPVTAGGAIALTGAILAGVGLVGYSVGRDRQALGTATDVAFADSSVGGVPVPLFEDDSSPVEFVPPDGVRPAQFALLLHERVRTVDVSATIVDLAVRGYLRIEEVGEGRKRDYRFVRLRNDATGLLDYEATLFDALVPAVSGQKLLSDHEDSFASDMADVIDKAYQDGQQRSWFRRRPDKVRTGWRVLGVLALTVALGVMALAAIFTHAALLTVPLVLGAFFLLVAAGRMPARTPVGTGLTRRSRGFETFLRDSEAPRARWAEQKNIFSEYLPYTIVLGCADRWAKTFEPLGDAAVVGASTWYVGTHPFSTSDLATSTSSFAGSASSTLTSTPSSSGSSGFSGGGGGGFSGGGGGGGGGGSW